MAQQAQQDSLEQAIGWRIRLRDNRPEDWEAFVLWLEGDPARSAAYDQIAFADSDLTADAVPAGNASQAANDDWIPDSGERDSPRRKWMTALAAIVAIFVFGFVAMPWLGVGSSRYEVATAAGEQRTISIGEGSSAALNGGTRIVLDRDNARYAELSAGEATFTVRHDPDRPFLVVSGDHRLQDVGTVFNLVRDGPHFFVEVVDGAVLYNPDGEAITLARGQTLTHRQGEGRLIVGRRDPKEMAGWRRGQLSYAEVPLVTVARDLSRSIGADVKLDPAIAEQSFTGSIRIDGSDEATVTRLASALDLEAHRSGEDWLIEPHERARR